MYIDLLCELFVLLKCHVICHVACHVIYCMLMCSLMAFSMLTSILLLTSYLSTAENSINNWCVSLYEHSNGNNYSVICHPSSCVCPGGLIYLHFHLLQPHCSHPVILMFDTHTKRRNLWDVAPTQVGLMQSYSSFDISETKCLKREIFHTENLSRIRYFILKSCKVCFRLFCISN